MEARVLAPRQGRHVAACTAKLSLVVAAGLLGLPAWANEVKKPKGERAARAAPFAGPKGSTRVEAGDDGLKVTSPDETLKLQIGGRLHLDGGAGSAGPGIPDAVDPNLAVRRARIESQLTIRDAAEIVFQYDFADRASPVKNAGASYRGLSGYVFSVGNMKEPFSLGQLISSNAITFVERALPDALVPGRNTGFAVATTGERWTASGGVYGGNINTGIGRGGTAATARVTYAPILTDHEVLHLGAAGSFRAVDPSPGGDNLSFSFRPEANLFRVSLIDTDTITGAREVGRLGIEAAYQNGPFRLQGEYIATHVGRAGGLPAAHFHGAYLEAAWTVNGNGRSYNLSTDYGTAVGVFGRVILEDAQRVSRGGIGVFEVATRVSFLDLQDRDVRGGAERNWTLGLNWYADKNVRVMANYVRAHVEASPATGGDIDADIGVARLQFYW